MTKRENDAIWTAAEKANRQCGQWMPQRWIEIFIKELASAPPATSAGLGADEIARIIATKCFDPRVIDSSGKPFWKKSQWSEAQKAANAILALLSRDKS